MKNHLKLTMKTLNKQRFLVCCTSIAMATLVACGGGGGSDSNNTSADTPASSSPTSSSPTAPNDAKACLLEGSITLLGVTSEIKDCAQNNGDLSLAQLKQYCESLSEIGAQLGATPAKITYLGACPSGQQGSCTGATLLPTGITAYYYARPDVPSVKASCESSGGAWK